MRSKLLFACVIGETFKLSDCEQKLSETKTGIVTNLVLKKKFSFRRLGKNCGDLHSVPRSYHT